MFYLLACRDCGDPERPLPMPFESPADRGKWATAHTTATGHERWIVKDEAGPETWEEALAAFEAATPVKVVRSPRTVTVEYRHEGGAVIATSPELPGLQRSGRNLDEARSAMRDLLEPFLDLGVTIAERPL